LLGNEKAEAHEGAPQFLKAQEVVGRAEMDDSSSVEETEDFATNVLGTSLVVVHDTLVGGKDNDTELTGGKDSVGEVFELAEGEIEAGGDHTALVQTAVQVDNDLAGTGVIDDLKLVDVAVFLHNLEEFDEDLGDGSQDDLK
jgi:hypothetical protein